jgi:hypothetical protein
MFSIARIADPADGESIEEYGDDTPDPSHRVLGSIQESTFHVEAFFHSAPSRLTLDPSFVGEFTLT